MTILPKKKASKEKGEIEKKPEHPPHGTYGHSSHTHNSGEARTSARRPSSPTQWLPLSSRDERLSPHDPGGRYEEYRPHESNSSHKRRHRSSPHRNVSRKHRERHEHQLQGSTSHTSTSGHGHSRGSIIPSTSSEHPASSDTIEDSEEINSGYNSGDEYVPPQHPENIEELERWFATSLKDKTGFIIKAMREDGACLFRAIADQVYGDQEMHSMVRQSCVDYMAKNRDFFSQYVTEDFNTYLNRKRMPSCHGNHIEMQALSEVYNRPIEVYQFSTEPINTFHGAYKTDNEPIRISYHRSVHYNSIVHPYKASVGVGLGLPGHQPGLADKNLMRDALQKSENFHIEKTMLEDKLRETDWEVTQDTIEEQVARESYLQWLRDNEKRAKRQTSPRSASATCSSASDAQCWWESTGSPDPRTNRSPRNRSANNSAQNSPNRTEQPGPASPKLESQNVVRPSTSREVDPPPCSGATGGAGISFPETTSIMNDLPPQWAGMSEWDEDDIMAQVIAQSQQEYLDSLKKNISPSSSATAPDSPEVHQKDPGDKDS